MLADVTGRPKGGKLPPHWREYLIHAVFVGIFVVCAATLYDKGFLSAFNLMTIARQTAMIAIMAVGMTFVLSAAEIDLSFAAVVGLAAIISALVLRHTGSMALASGAALAAGALIGAVNGFFVTRVGIPSFLVTLGTMGIVTGAARWISNLQSIPVTDEGFVFVFGGGDIGPVPVLFLWTLGVAVAGALVLNRTTFGQEVVATGGNKISALHSGIQVGRIKLQVLVLNGVLAALAGLLYAGRLQGARYTLGENDLMIVIAAVIIGGTSLFGGKGTVVGSVLGALVMGMVSNGLILAGLSVDQHMILRGVIIIAAVTLTMGTILKTKKIRR